MRVPVSQSAVGVALTAGLALLLRASLIDGQSLDLEAYQAWLDFIRANGGFHALEFEFSNYAPLFTYVLVVGSYLPDIVGDNVILKGASIASDFVCAYFVLRIVARRGGNQLMPVSAFALVLFAPTVLLNGAHWGQTDMVTTAALVACLWFVLDGKPFAAMVAFGIALAFKQQALFLGPFLLLLAFKRVIPWRHFLAVPVIYIVSIIPAALAGRSIWNLLTIYERQASDRDDLTLEAPSAWQWIPENHADILGRLALIWGISVVLLLTLLVAALPFELTQARLVALATASVLVTPFVLPRMHDRYFFAADVLSIVLVFFVPRLFAVALLVQLASLFSYWPTHFNGELIPLHYVAFANLAAIVLLLVWMAREIISDQTRSGAAGPAPGGTLGAAR